ncbi:MAG: histidinol phosphate phosphatase [Candidatus Melainabacteria bacterium]|nr:histidinol phosphate phosphatase [Candidatus Melainabacteria bacterium]
MNNLFGSQSLQFTAPSSPLKLDAGFGSCREDLLALALRAADNAAAVVRHYFESQFQSGAGFVIEHKDAASPLVTIADREAERAIRSLIESAAPNHSIIGEEFGRKRGDSRYTWVLDPIDGTLAFATGKLSFGTLLGLMDGEQLVLGIIDQPILKERWVGFSGQPTTLNGRVVSTRKVGRLEDAILSITTPVTFDSQSRRNALERLQRRVRITSYGGDCYHFGLLASGCIDLICEAGFEFYDFAAVVPVIEGAGGVITDWQGKPLTENSNGEILAAGSEELHRQALGVIGGEN